MRRLSRRLSSPSHTAGRVAELRFRNLHPISTWIEEPGSVPAAVLLGVQSAATFRLQRLQAAGGWARCAAPTCQGHRGSWREHSGLPCETGNGKHHGLWTKWIRSMQGETWKLEDENQYREHCCAGGFLASAATLSVSYSLCPSRASLLGVWPVLACPLAVATPSGCAVCVAHSVPLSLTSMKMHLSGLCNQMVLES